MIIKHIRGGFACGQARDRNGSDDRQAAPMVGVPDVHHMGLGDRLPVCSDPL